MLGTVMQRLARKPVAVRGMRAAARAWDRYSRALDTNPYATKSITAGVIGISGDLLCQNVEQPGTVDAERLGRFGLVATCFIGPVLHVWYTYLGRAIPGVKLSAVAKRIALDGFAFAPFQLTAVMGMLMTLQDPKTDVVARLKKDMPGTLLACWAIWTPVQFVNFRYVPVKYQVLVVNTVGVAWNAFVSFIANK